MHPLYCLRLKSEVHKFLKIRGKALVINNQVYSIPNISFLEVGKIERSLAPVLVLLAIGVAGLLSGNGLFGVVFLGLAVALYYWLFVLNKRYGLRLVTNSGAAVLIVWKDQQFLQQVTETIYDVMNSEVLHDVNIFLDQRKIDRSLHIGSTGDIVNSTIATGDMNGRIYSDTSSASKPVKIAVTTEEVTKLSNEDAGEEISQIEHIDLSNRMVHVSEGDDEHVRR